MIIDTSALLAILLAEPEAETFVTAISKAGTRFLPSPLFVEASAAMLGRKGPAGVIALDALLHRLEIEIVAMSPEAGSHARACYERYGKGVGSPGVLNFGDCLAAGVAKALNEPLLFKGDDFSRTDVDAAV